MNKDPGRGDRAPLEDLVERARAGLRDWTDTTHSDPGVALLELFAFLAELLTFHAEHLAREAYLRTGRRHPHATCGIHAAVVLDNADPLRQRRLFVQVPDISGDDGVWAVACLPPSGASEVPATGDGVWVALESGDPARPIWLGQRITD
jgi:hypothetical protein